MSIQVLDFVPALHDRAGRIPCPRRAVLWRMVPTIRTDQVMPHVDEYVALLVRCTSGAPIYSAELGRNTPLFLEVREGPPPVGTPDRPEGDLGPLVARLDLDGEDLIDRPCDEAEPVLFGEREDDELLVAELALERGGWSVSLVGGG
jgi:hypothetical protein